MISIYTLSSPEEKENTRYIGQTSNEKSRYNNHLKGNKYRKTHTTNWIQSLLDKGLKPIMTIIDNCLEEDLDITEQSYIKLFKSFGANLTNHSIGGHSSLGCKHSLESRMKRSINSKGRKCNYSKESLEKKKKLHSEYLVQNPKQRIDNILTKEERYKAALKGNKIASEKNKKAVIKFNLYNNVIKEYNSITEAAKDNKVCTATIQQKCSGRRAQTGEYIYKYKTTTKK